MDYDKVYISQEILRRLGVKFKPNRIKQNISCWDHEDRTPSLSVNLEKGIYHCFSCGCSGTLVNKYWQTFHRSIKWDLGLNSNNLLQVYTPTEKIDYSLIPEVDFIFEGKRLPLDITDAGKNWIKQRGFTKELLDEFKVTYSQFGVFKQKSDTTNKEEWIYVINRALFPIVENSTVISYEIRDIMGKTFYEKQLEKKGLKKEDHPYRKVLYPRNSSVNTLYGLKKLKKDQPLFIVEGLMDLISLRSHSYFENSTCLFHALPTERQYYLLDSFREIIFIPDNDEPGIRAMTKTKERLPKSKVLRIPKQFKDINDIIKPLNKDSRIKSIQNLLDLNWLNKTIPISRFDIEVNIKLLGENNDNKK